MIFRRYFQRRKMRQIREKMGSVVRMGWNPLEAVRAAVHAECGYPPFDREPTYDYLARASCVSRETVDRYMKRMKAGDQPTPEMASVEALMVAVGRRLSGRPARCS